MQSEHDALLRTVLEQPDDDTPRLIYADWMEEFGDESERARASFIRFQIEQKNYVDPFWEAHELLRIHWREWLRNGFNHEWDFGRGGDNQFDAHRPGSPKIIFS